MQILNDRYGADVTSDELYPRCMNEVYEFVRYLNSTDDVAYTPTKPAVTSMAELKLRKKRLIELGQATEKDDALKFHESFWSTGATLKPLMTFKHRTQANKTLSYSVHVSKTELPFISNITKFLAGQRSWGGVGKAISKAAKRRAQ